MINLMLGDCLEIMKEIPDGSVDMVLTDPPYGMNYQSNRRTVRSKFGKIANDTSTCWLPDFVREAHRTMADNSALYCFCSWHNIDQFKTAIEMHFRVKNVLVWVKNNHGSGDLTGSYAPQHEFVVYAHKGRSILRAKRVADVLHFPKVPSSQLLHPTEKNIEMLELFVANSSSPGATVLDPFMGSGTTGAACKNLNRNFIGIEKDETYFKIAQERIGVFT